MSVEEFILKWGGKDHLANYEAQKNKEQLAKAEQEIDMSRVNQEKQNNEQALLHENSNNQNSNTTNKDASLGEGTLKLKKQAQNEVLNNFYNYFITGLFLIIIAGLASLVSWLSRKITGKKIQDKLMGRSSRVRRLINFSIDFFIIINSFSCLVAYLAISKEWSGIFEHWWRFSVGSIIFYYIFFEGLLSRTPGKFITRTKVIMKDGSKPDLGQIILRTLIRLIPFEIFSFIGKNPLGWHDKWSNTMVVPSNYNSIDRESYTETKYCKECGHQLDSSAKICDKCNKITNK